MKLAFNAIPFTMMNQDNEGTFKDILDQLSDGRDIPALREALRYSNNDIQA
jgi:hypothetical protein